MSEFIQTDRQEEFERIRAIEGSKEYQDKLDSLRVKMKNNIQWKIHLMLGGVIGVVLVLFLRIAGLVIAGVLGLIYIYPKYKERKELFGGKKQNNELLYIEEFLDPILKEIFPQGNIKVNSNFSLDAIKTVTPTASKYDGFYQISFNDESELAVINLWGYHINQTTNSKGETKHDTVTDFRGQVFRMRFPHRFSGHIRVIPTQRSFVLKKEVQDYPDTQNGEMKIDTEDIQHNENYNIYCTDELAARKFLNPTVLDWFDKNIASSSTAIYIEEDTLYISRYTDRYLFPVPDTIEEIDNISMIDEYENLRNEVDFIDSFTQIFR